jgi:hypothetical protein
MIYHYSSRVVKLVTTLHPNLGFFLALPPPLHGPHLASRPIPGPVQILITHAHMHWSRHHQARLPHFTPWARLTLLSRALTLAHPQSSITSLRKSRRLAGLTRNARRYQAKTLCPHAMKACAPSKQCHGGCLSQTNHDRAQPPCAQWFWPCPPHTGVAGSTPDPTAARYHRCHTPLAATASLLRRRSRQVYGLPAGCHGQGSFSQPCSRKASRPERAAFQGCIWTPLQGHHSLGSVGDPPPRTPCRRQPRTAPAE